MFIDLLILSLVIRVLDAFGFLVSLEIIMYAKIYAISLVKFH